jgi:hypothetical protein
MHEQVFEMYQNHEPKNYFSKQHTGHEFENRKGACI